jgi:hypothetical protein
VTDKKSENLPLAALGAIRERDGEGETPLLAYLARIPLASSYREMIERAVGWGRR